MTDGRIRYGLAITSAAIIIAAIVSCSSDPGPPLCQPHALLYDTDSVIFAYADGRVRSVLYYGSGRRTNRDDYTYNSSGRLAIITKSSIGFDGDPILNSQHVITYGEDGKPATLVTTSSSGYFTTTFTHNNDGLLSIAHTTSGIGKSFIGSTRYEYDDDGNIPNVFYTIDVNHQITEVLARENLEFDDSEKFYKDNDELKIVHEYIYGYLPNRNNCLSSTVHYYSYAQHFTSPVSISFVATYDNEGLIKSLQSEGPNTRLYSGEVLFKKVLYDCR
jgi:hypothetical protein